MIEIIINNKFIPERTYVLDVIAEYLNFDYKLTVNKTVENVEFHFNGKKIIIIDVFFSKFVDGTKYLNSQNIPQSIAFGECEFISENNIPILFGTNNIKIEEQEIICGIDIIASIFFMLTRWEEITIKTLDSHSRFPASESVAFKNIFLHRPVVDEYIMFFYKMLYKIGYSGNVKHRKFEITLTHDIDYFYKWSNFSKFLKTLAGDILVRKKLKVLFSNISLYYKIQKNKALDPNDSFDYFMNLAEKAGIKSHFFFMSGGKTKNDNHYEIANTKVHEKLNQIIEREHIIGIHPSYETYLDKNQFQHEKMLIEKLTLKKLTCGRQHYLRFEIPTTWQIWDDLGFEWDSSMYYSEKMGFRSGACFEYNVFNCLTRQKLNLREKPLIVMDTSILNDKKTSWEIHKKNIKDLFEKVKKYNGNFVILWHNSNVNTYESAKIKKLFETMLEKD